MLRKSFKLFIASLVILTKAAIGIAQIHIGPGQTYSNLEAASSAIMPGDTVYVHAGIYNNYQYVDGLKGLPNKWITFKRFEHDSIVIRGTWQISSGAYLHFVNLFFEGDGQKENSIRFHIDNKGDCALNGHHILVENCYFGNVDDSNSFKFGGVDTFEVRNCVFKNNSTNFAGIALNICHDGIVTGCYFENMKTKAIQTKLGCRNITIEKNFFKNCGTADAVLKIGESGGLNFHCAGDDWTAKDIFVYSNIILGGRTPFTIGQSQDCKFVNNTFIFPEQFVLRVLPDQPVFTLKNHLIANNIFYLKKTIYLNGSNDSTQNVFIKTVEINNNVFYNVDNPTWSGPDPNGGAYDAEELKGAKFINNFSFEPIFENFINNNYKPAVNSPVVGTGLDVSAPTEDFYGNGFLKPRSIGASEKEKTTQITGIENSTSQFTVFPNPINMQEDINIILPSNQKINLIKVLDLNGKVLKVIPQDGNQESAKINLELKNTGVYFLLINTTSKSTFKQKLIVY